MGLLFALIKIVGVWKKVHFPIYMKWQHMLLLYTVGVSENGYYVYHLAKALYS